MSCGGENLKYFMEKAGRNAIYPSDIAVVVGTWIEESMLKRLHKAFYYSIVADKCTDISSVFLGRRWCSRGAFL